MAEYVPRKGDFIAVTLDPRSGHEQRGRRPALVVSNDLFDKHTGLCLVCPITSTRRDYSFHAPKAMPDAGRSAIGEDEQRAADLPLAPRTGRVE